MSVEREALRYLGVRGEADARTRRVVSSAIALARAHTALKHAHRVCACAPVENGVALNGVVFLSRDLAALFENATSGIALVGTLGLAADRLIARQAALGIFEAAVMQAALSALLEEALDALTGALAIAHPGRRLSGRFSPGYGDLDLKYQRPLIELAGGAHLGIELNDAFMMRPLKTVTALVALGRTAAPCAEDRCARCGKADCAYRRDKA